MDNILKVDKMYQIYGSTKVDEAIYVHLTTLKNIEQIEWEITVDFSFPNLDSKSNVCSVIPMLGITNV